MENTTVPRDRRWTTQLNSAGRLLDTGDRPGALALLTAITAEPVPRGSLKHYERVALVRAYRTIGRVKADLGDTSGAYRALRHAMALHPPGYRDDIWLRDVEDAVQCALTLGAASRDQRRRAPRLYREMLAFLDIVRMDWYPSLAHAYAELAFAIGDLPATSSAEAAAVYESALRHLHALGREYTVAVATARDRARLLYRLGLLVPQQDRRYASYIRAARVTLSLVPLAERDEADDAFAATLETLVPPPAMSGRIRADRCHYRDKERTTNE